MIETTLRFEGLYFKDKDGWIKRLFTGDIFKSEIAKNNK